MMESARAGLSLSAFMDWKLFPAASVPTANAETGRDECKTATVSFLRISAIHAEAAARPPVAEPAVAGGCLQAISQRERDDQCECSTKACSANWPDTRLHFVSASFWSSRPEGATTSKFAVH